MKFSTGMKIQIYNKTKKSKFSLTNLPPNKLTNSHGFSFVELIVAVAIMAVITSAVLFRQAKFSSDILITNMTYEIALAIRQAQVYGISSKQSPLVPDQNGDSSLGQYKVGYGIHFEPGPGNSSPKSYFEFIDLPTTDSGIGINTEFNYKYDGPSEYIPNNEGVITLSQGRIRQYCGGNGSSWVCWPENSVELDIVFVKPNPDAHITTIDSNGGSTSHGQSKIVVESALGDKCRTVTVYGSGQISVDPVVSENGGCDPL